MFQIEDIIRYMGGNPEGLTELDYLWAESEASYPADGNLPFLAEDTWRRAYDYCDIPGEVLPAVERTIAKVKSDERLLHLLWNIYYRQKGPERAAKKGVKGWPQPESLGEEKHFFYLLPALAIADAVIEQHRRRGIPDEVTRSTLSKIGAQMTYLYKRDFGRIGIGAEHIGWLPYYRDEPYIRLGRFEYWVRYDTTNYFFYAYRNSATGECVAFPMPDTKFTYQGDKLTDAAPEKMPFWVSRFEDDGKVVTGTPYSPRGYAINKSLTLDLRQWRRIYTPGETLIAQMHIPQGGKMTPDACRESLQQVAPFFKKYYGLEIEMVTTTSWIFGSHLRYLLPENANLLDFQRKLYCMPMGYHELAIGMYFIFPKNEQPFNPRLAPQDNSLRRAVVQYLLGGGQWRGGGMFFMLDDIAEYDNDIYRKRWDNGVSRLLQ